MALDVTAVLEELHCVKESQGGSESYIWPVLLWLDDTTINNAGDDVLGVRGPVLGDARVVLKQDMKAGESAPIPFPLGSLGVRLEAASGISFVLLVVALWITTRRLRRPCGQAARLLKASFARPSFSASSASRMR